MRGLPTVLLSGLLAAPLLAAPVRIVMEWGGGDNTKLHWDGQLTVEGGKLLFAENYMMDGPETVSDLTESSVKFSGLTEGATDGMIVVVDGPPETKFTFDSPVKRFEFTLAQLLGGPIRVQANEAGAGVSVTVGPGVALKTPRQECRLLVQDSEGRVWTVGIETDGPETKMASRQKLVLARVTDEAWEPVADVAEPGVLYYPSVAADREGGLWIAWSEFESRRWDVYVRHFDGAELGQPRRLTTTSGPDIMPAVAVTSTGPVVVYMSGRAGGRWILESASFRNGRWQTGPSVSQRLEVAHRPVLAVGPDDTVWVAYDAYDRVSCDYDVFLRSYRGGRVSERIPLLASGAEEMDASVAIDRSGTVWVAASGRCVGVRAGERVTPPASLTLAARLGNRAPNEVATDAAGRLWLFAGLPAGRNQPAQLRAACVADGAQPVAAGASVGPGYRPPLVLEDGSFWHSSETQVVRISVPLPRGYPSSPTVVASPVPSDAPFLTKPEPVSTARRRHRVEVDGKERDVYFGELHTHLGELPTDRTIRTWVDRFYNHARYIAQLDIASVSDHDWPPMTLSKFMAQQAFAAVHNAPERFVSCIGWEWSGHGPTRYRYGDRTIVFQEDYCDILRITDEQGNEPAKLHAYMRSVGAIDWPHHVGAPWAVMDWDTLSPTEEPVVEMVSTHGVYETYEEGRAIGLWRGAPKQSRDDSGDKTSIQYGLKQGHKFGLVGSSDSHSGLSGYGTGMLAVFTDDLTRGSVFDGWRARRTYALRGGERILLDFRIGDTFMGSEMTTEEAPRLSVKVVGTKPIRKVEVIRDNEYIYTASGRDDTDPNRARELAFQHLDLDAAPGKHYYYLRVFQEGEAYAWSSPIWVTVVGR